MNVARCYWIFRQNSFELVVLSCANQRKANFFRNMLCHVIADMPIMQFVIEGDFIHFFFLVHTDTLNIFSASSHCIMQNSCHTKYVFFVVVLFFFDIANKYSVFHRIEYLLLNLQGERAHDNIYFHYYYCLFMQTVLSLFAKIPTQMTVKWIF